MKSYIDSEIFHDTKRVMNLIFLQESSGDTFQADHSSRGGMGSSPTRGRGRGRGGGFGRGASNIGQDNFRGVQDSSNRGPACFGGAHLPQEQNMGSGFRDHKSGLSAGGDFVGYGMLQQDHGAKSTGSEPAGNFGDHGVGQRPVIGGPNSAGHDGFGSQHGFGPSATPTQDSKSGPAFGGPVPSIQDPKMLQCGPNRGSSDFGGNTSQPDCSALSGNFGVPPPTLAQQDSKGMPAASNQASADFGGSPLPQKPSNMPSPNHAQQLTSAPKSTGDEKKTATEGEIQSDEKDKSNNTGKLEFVKNAADGIPGLDLLAERDKQNDGKSTAEDIELSVGHDIDERTLDMSVNPGGFIGPVPAPTSSEQSNDQGIGR